MKLLFYDLETTGLHAATCGIHQLAGAIAEYDERSNALKFLDNFNFKMRPHKGKRVYPSALEVGGITMDMIQSYPEPNQVFNEFMAYLKKHVNKFDPDDKMFLVGFNNLHFDNEFLRQWFTDCGEKYYGSFFWSNSIDVMSEASRILLQLRPYMPNFKLATVAKTLGMKVEDDSLHDGMYDIRLTAKIFIECMKNPQIRPLEGRNLGEMKQAVLAYKEEQKREAKKPKGQESYVVF